MHGLGNDFVVIDSISQQIDIVDLPIQKLSNRMTGIGFDQLLLIAPSHDADFSCRFFNADGSEAEQCGNGVRCAARYFHEKKLSAKKSLLIETIAGIIPANIFDYQHIEVKLGIPSFDKNKILELQNKQYEMTVLSLGNPHAILGVNSVNLYPINEIGSQISTHPAFPSGVNVGFMEVIDPQHIVLRTYERGVGKTFACGSNACAAVAAGIINKQLKNKVIVELELGQLQIEWQGDGHSVVMTGPAETVFEGEM